MAWEELFSSLAVVELGWGGEPPASEGRCTAPGRELLPSLGGRWAIAGVWLKEGPWLFVWLFTELLVILLMLLAWLLRKLLPSSGRWTVAGGGIRSEHWSEHLKAPSAIHHHSTLTGHTTNHNNFQIIGREGHNLARNIKESIYIRVNNPSLNNNIGKFNLSHIWDRVLLNTKGLTLK